MEKFLRLAKKIIPHSLFKILQPHYHKLLASWAAIKYNNPSRELTVIGVTGTKGKSSTVEILHQILQSSGKKTAALSTIRFKIGDKIEDNRFKMTMPGRLFVQKFLRTAVSAGCTHAVIEMTSEGVKQSRHKFIDLDMLIFTNLSPEHIESHGSFEKYKAAKLELAKAVETSTKRPRFLVANIDDRHGADFLNFKVEHKLPYSLNDLNLYTLQKDSISLVLKNNITVRAPLLGKFNIYNTLAAIVAAQAMGVSDKVIVNSLKDLPPIPGRVEQFFSPNTANKKIVAVVDYAHTPDSLEKLYQTFADKRKICVLGNTGGGRDTWKRPEMGSIAEKYCQKIILTNEDPYDENPRKILNEMIKGIKDKTKVEIILDRRQAIKKALSESNHGDYILISGKGTDPYIMGPNGSKEIWSDAKVVKELLSEL